MHCKVCQVALPERGSCLQCGYDASAPQADDVHVIARARERWKATTLAFAPGSRVTVLDRLKPWFGLALGVCFFLFWLRACHGHGRVF